MLHIKNIQPSVPLAYSKIHKETREVMRMILDKLNYREHNWLICADLKVVGLLMGIQGGNCSYPCFKCLWHKGSKKLHYTKKVWPKRPKVRKIGQYNVVGDELVDRKAIIFPALHIKLGLMTQLISALMKRVKEIRKQRQLKRKQEEEEEEEAEEEAEKEDDDDDDDSVGEAAVEETDEPGDKEVDDDDGDDDENDGEYSVVLLCTLFYCVFKTNIWFLLICRR